MATTLSAQLQAIRNIAQLEPEAHKRPFIRPSILFDPKEAADLDLDTLLAIALSGLEALAAVDKCFGGYKVTLFSHKSRDVDRELMGLEENKSLNASISSYLRLLAGFLNMHSALKTLEYLIRRYKIHVYNMEDLVLCALPYHDTTTFVRIVQLLQLSGKWVFLEGVKSSGASLPRKVIVQQCIKDAGILETLCNYATTSKKIQAPREVICFCTAVIVEAVGAMPILDNIIVKRVLPFVYEGFNTAMNGGDDDHKAGSLMIVGLLATRAALAPKLINSLIIFIARSAQQDAQNSAGLPGLRLSLMAIVNIVQSQNIHVLPKKALGYFQQEMGDFVGILVELSKEFNIDKFMCVYLGSLIDYSSSDSSLVLSLSAIIESGLVKELVDRVVSKVLLAGLKLMEKTGGSNFHEPGFWAREIFDKINKLYPLELRVAVQKSFENPKMQSKRELVFEFLHKLFDGGLNMPLEISNSKLWFSLEHPKAEVRKAAVCSLASSGMLKTDSKNRANVEEVILRRLQDDDLSVILEALSINGLFEVMNPLCLFKAFHDIVVRCVGKLYGHANESAKACEVAISCLSYAVLHHQRCEMDYSEEIASMMFPLLLILPKTWRLNFKALELIKRTQWPFYEKLRSVQDDLIFSVKKFDSTAATSINFKTMKALAENLMLNPQVSIGWMLDCCKKFDLSKTVFFLVMLVSFMMQTQADLFMALFKAFFPIFKIEWSAMDSQEDGSLIEEFDYERLDDICHGIMGKLLDWKPCAVNRKVLICTYQSIVRTATTMFNEDNTVDTKQKMQIVENLFVFSASSSLQTVLLDQLLQLVMKGCLLPVQCMKRFIVDEGFSSILCITSIQFFRRISSSFLSSKNNNLNVKSQMQLLCEFPSLLVPLASDVQDIRDAALDCVECFHQLSNLLENKMSEHTRWKSVYGELLGLILWQKKLITSDANVLSSLLESLLGPSSSFLMPQNIKNRFDESTKKVLLDFMLGFSFNLSPNGKLKMLSLFKRIGSSIMDVDMVRSLLFELLDRRIECSVKAEGSADKLSPDDIDMLCILLEICASIPKSNAMDTSIVTCMLKALQVDHISSDDFAMMKPCVTVLTSLSSAFYDSLGTEMQDEFFRELVILIRNDNGDIHGAITGTLLRINVSCATVIRFLDRIAVDEPLWSSLSYNKPKRKKSCNRQNGQSPHTFVNRGSTTSLLASLLDVLLLKKDILNRASLIEPLFRLLHRTYDKNWIVGLVGENKKENLESILEIQQTILIVLEDITTSLSSHLSKVDDVSVKIDIDLLIKCARTANSPTACNHVFLLLASIAKVFPEQVLSHILDISTVLGESTIIQNDSHSQRVFEDLMCTVVPYWISRTSRVDELLQIFVNTLPKVAEHRKLSLFVFLLRILGEKESLGLLVVLLFRSMIQRKEEYCSNDHASSLISHSSELHVEWEYMFALQVCEQYNCTIWLRSMVIVLQKSDMDGQDLVLILIVIRFIHHKLKDTGFAFLLEAGQDEEEVQMMLSVLMETVINKFQRVCARDKEDSICATLRREVKQCTHDMLKTVARSMYLSTYFKTMTRLLQHGDENVTKKALLLISEAVDDYDVVQQNRKGKTKLNQKLNGHKLSMDMTTNKLFAEMCSKIVQLIDVSLDHSVSGTKVSAISTVEVLANKFPSNDDTFVKCLTCVTNYISSDNLTLSSSCLRCIGALVNVLGARALAMVPRIMEDTLKKARDSLFLPLGETNDDFGKAVDDEPDLKEYFLLSILIMLEAVVDKFGGFLNPYLQDVIKLLVLNPECSSRMHLKLQQKADAVKILVTEKIPVRLLVSPLLKMYPEAIHHGDWSISEFLQMLTRLISKMDRSSLYLYHAKIFDQCLLSLDLRRQQPSSVKDIDAVEECVTNAFVILTMKLTEAMFRPLFIHCLEWAETEFERDCSGTLKNIDRIISLYKLINKLVEQHRSLFVPYFKYLLESCTKYLTDDQDYGLIQKWKKAKKTDKNEYGSGNSSILQWHLRALILSSLHKCFLHDTGNQKILDSTNFQTLLKPIVSQLSVQPPKSLEQYPSIPSAEEVDDTLVSCLGQMAVTAGTDVLWQSLNHEVLMQTRSEEVRPRILGLRVVKCLVDRLNEDYVAACLTETVRFLGELLEDMELPVKTLAQQILKEMETISGENIQEYL